MATVQDVIQDALEMIAVYAPGEPMNAADSARGLSVLNDMQDSWSNENLICFAIVEQQLTFVPGQRSYTIGTSGGADVALTRPITLRKQPGSAYVLDNNGNIYGMDVITQAQWNMRGSRNTNSNFPDVIFYDPQFPLGVLNFDPIPNIGYVAKFDSMLQLSDFATLTTAIQLPPGYKAAIGANLALWLADYYPSAIVTPSLRNKAAETKRVIKISNRRLDTAVYDPEITARAPGVYNIYTDSYRR